MHTNSTIYKQLQPEDRMTIASLRQQNFSIRRIAMVLQRSPSTISREATRNSEQGTYASVSSQQSCHHRRCHSRPERKLHPQSVLFGMVHNLLCSRWSPEQIGGNSR
jgi:IS30 family transposase